MSNAAQGLDGIEAKLNKEKRDIFWEFIAERHKIWHRRVIEEKTPPWTTDEILQKYRFTNVYRRLDPGTQYAIQKILEVDASKPDKIFNIMLYRLIGRLETHKHIGFQYLKNFDRNTLEAQLKYRRDVEDKPVFTGAYMVAGYSQMGSSDKVENVSSLFSEIASNNAFFSDLLSAPAPQEAYCIIRSQPGFGNFLSYQVLVDLLYGVDCYDGDSILSFTANEWSSPGPGAQKGLKRLVTEFNGFTRLDVMRWLYENQQKEFERLDLEFPFLRTDANELVELSLADIQNCLCEFYKYDKIRNSEGRARRRFETSEGRSKNHLQSIYESAPGFSIKAIKQ